MGAIGIEKANSLFWLGRYIERVYSTTLYYEKLFDRMLDVDPSCYHEYCKQIDIPDIYLNDAHFMISYLYDTDNPDSIVSNLKRAYDNAIVLREEISSEVLAYIQMGMNTFDRMEESEAPILLLQDVIDDIYAYRGSMAELMDDKPARDIILIGEYVERIDLYLRLGYDSHSIQIVINQLSKITKEFYEENKGIKGVSSIEINSENVREMIDLITSSFNY